MRLKVWNLKPELPDIAWINPDNIRRFFKTKSGVHRSEFFDRKSKRAIIQIEPNREATTCSKDAQDVFISQKIGRPSAVGNYQICFGRSDPFEQELVKNSLVLRNHPVLAANVAAGKVEPPLAPSMVENPCYGGEEALIVAIATHRYVCRVAISSAFAAGRNHAAHFTQSSPISS